MSKCESCIHYDVCCEMITKHNKSFFVCGDEGNEGQHYKDKSIVVELPCKVGDEVWYCQLGTSEVCQAKVIKIDINYYTPHNPFWFTIEYNSNLIGLHESVLHEPEFKELCFKSKEAAEKKLKEYEEK